jgi:hypothetical protein
MAEIFGKKGYITLEQIEFFDLVMTIFCERLLEV